MTARSFVIAIDGPAASGKGTLARRLAEHFGFAYLDTGALYRATAFLVLEQAGDPADPVIAARALLRAASPRISASPISTPERFTGQRRFSSLSRQAIRPIPWSRQRQRALSILGCFRIHGCGLKRFQRRLP